MKFNCISDINVTNKVLSYLILLNLLIISIIAGTGIMSDRYYTVSATLNKPQISFIMPMLTAIEMK